MSKISHDNLESAIFAGGCFWCTESDFSKRPDIKDIQSGYIGGETDNPSYNTAGQEGHREAVRVWFDPGDTSYRKLLAYFFSIHDPTDAGGSFYDRGHTYTSAIYYLNDAQKKAAEQVIAELDQADVFSGEIVTEVLPKDDFWPAEDYHQNYADKNPARYQAYHKASGREEFTTEHKEAVFAALGL